MQPTDKLDETYLDEFEQDILLSEDPITTEAERIQRIVEAKYSKADLPQVAKSCKTISEEEQEHLLASLKKFEHLFDGTLGTWNTEPVDLELKDPNCKPCHAKPYPVPHAHEQLLKEEMDRLCNYGVVRKINSSEWASPVFTVPKSDNTLRSIGDFRAVNTHIKRKPFPLPKISDLLHKLEGFTYATSLDLTMGYYHIALTPEASKLCAVVLPWGKYEYLKLPMGLCNSPNIFQEKMNELMEGLEFVRAYLDDLLIVTKGSFQDHLDKLEQVLTRLAEAGLKVNVSKSHFCQHELEYLGYLINREGVRPTMKKVEAIKNLAPPKTRKQLRSFIGMVNYYRDMWPKRSHLLAPLTNLTSKNVKFKWTDEHQKAFDEIKTVIAQETMLTYPDFNKAFHLHTDASKRQLGAHITQDGKPIAFYSRKLTPAQTRYTTSERELLSIVETLKEFRTILLGQQIIVHTDHENLTYKNFNSDRVMRWRLFIEEYSPDLQYIKGTNNVVADALSRLEKTEQAFDDSKDMFYSLMQCLATENDHYDVHPVSYSKLDIAQRSDASIKKILKNASSSYYIKDFHGGGKTRSLVCYNDKIVVPTKLQ